MVRWVHREEDRFFFSKNLFLAPLCHAFSKDVTRLHIFFLYASRARVCVANACVVRDALQHSLARIIMQA
jgi:hypothetical protein